MDGFSESWGSRTEEMLRLSVMPTFGHEHKKMETIPSQTKAWPHSILYDGPLERKLYGL